MPFIKAIALIILVTLLIGCSVNPFEHDEWIDKLSQSQTDDSFAEDEIQDGTAYLKQPRHYKVRGKWYHVLNHSKGYHAKGYASFYSNYFHNRRTASGERYNKNKLTAAHKTLPIPSYLKVKNLENGREIFVKVNDRGPFRNNYVVDLSYAAAKKLGMLGQGTSMVEIATIDAKTFTTQQKNSHPVNKSLS